MEALFDEEHRGMDEEEERSGCLKHLPAEMWLYCFAFLDLKSLLVVSCICKVFHDIVKCESIWKEICLRTIPKDTLEELQSRDQQETPFSWLDAYKLVYSLDISGQRLNSICFGPNSDHRIGFINTLQVNLSPEQKILSNEFNLTEGQGQAPWGSFFVSGCRFGNYLSLTHDYEEFSVLTNYLCFIPLENGKTSVIEGYWRSMWQNSSGIFAGYQVFDEQQILEKLKDAASDRVHVDNQAKLNEVAGVWEASMKMLENARPHAQETDNQGTAQLGASSNRRPFRNHSCTFNLEKNFFGKVLTSTLPLSRSRSIVFGNLKHHMLSLTFRFEGGHLTAIAEMSDMKDEKWERMDGYMVFNLPSHPPRVGHFRAKQVHPKK